MHAACNDMHAHLHRQDAEYIAAVVCKRWHMHVSASCISLLGNFSTHGHALLCTHLL